MIPAPGDPRAEVVKELPRFTPKPTFAPDGPHCIGAGMMRDDEHGAWISRDAALALLHAESAMKQGEK